MHYSLYHQRLDYIIELLSKEAFLTPQYLAEKFDCSPRTIRRMINDLRDIGYNIEWCKKQKSYILLK